MENPNHPQGSAIRRQGSIEIVMAECCDKSIKKKRRHIGEELTEEELAIFDVLMKPAPEMIAKEQN